MNVPHVKILPRHGIYVTCFEGDGKRFARLFLEVWRQIPLSDRRCILKYWRDHNFPGVTRLCGEPRITLESKDLNSALDAGPGVCQCIGGALAFDAEWFERNYDPPVISVIAHELAHVFFLATKGEEHLTQKASNRERETDQQIRVWGFYTPKHKYKD